MNKKQLIFAFFLLCTVISYAQKVIKKQIDIPQEQVALSTRVIGVDPDFLKSPKFNSKAFGDTLVYEDFSGGLPFGWTIINNNSNNFEWKWDTIYRNGQFSTPANIITSTTAFNGFMALTGDFFNTPTPPTGAVAMNTYFESDSIDITQNGFYPNGTPSLWVSYQQTFRSCCAGPHKRVLQVSADNFATFQEYDATNALPLASASGTMTNVINISSAIANTTHIKVRFLSEGFSHYYWMIDDFTLIQGTENDLTLEKPYLEFNIGYQYNPFYSQIPYDLFPPLSLSSQNVNNGTNTLTNTRLEGNLTHTTYPNGSPGAGLVFITSSTPVTLSPGQIDTTITNGPRFLPFVFGEYSVDMLANSDSVNQNLNNATYSQQFVVSDSILARDDNGYGGGVGPGNYVRNGQTGGTAIGDKFGVMYIVESRSGNGGSSKIPTSITFAVSDDPSNIGVEIIPVIWSYKEDSLYTAGTIDAAFSGGVVASSFIPYTIQPLDTNTLLTLPLDNGSAFFNGLDSGQYVVGWKVQNTNGGNSFEVQQDASSGQFQKDMTCFIDFGHQPSWGWVDANPVIRLNFGNSIYIGIKDTQDKSVLLSVLPNPNNGLFTINVITKKATLYTLNVRNVLGKNVLSKKITIQNEYSITLDFSDLEKGVYFISVENQSNRWIEKVIIQ